MKKNHPESLQNCLTSFKKSWSDLDKILNLSENWQEIVGKDLANECRPLKIEKDILTIAANHPEWRQALIYNKHKLKESINQSGLQLKNIRIIQNYQGNTLKSNSSNAKAVWDEHPSRVKNKEILI